MDEYREHMEFADLATMREDYAAGGLSEADAGDDPVALFGRWLDDAVASGMYDPTAMALATATLDGQPSVRTVLLKGFDASGMVFFTHYESRKGRELQANPRAAATMLWHPLQRQVRVEGRVTRVPATQSDEYFASRPRGSQLGAAASPQSSVLADRAELDARLVDVERRFEDQPVQRPDNWGGYRLSLDVVEFWQGRTSRLHDRLAFTRVGDRWQRARLAP